MQDKYIVVSLKDAVTENKLFQLDFEKSIDSIEINEINLTPKESMDTRRDPQVMFVARSMPMQLITPLSADNEHNLMLEEQTEKATWGVRAIGAHASHHNGDGITIAVLDTGIVTDHLAFSNVELIRKNFTKNTSEDDTDGHGTHCAGTIFGRDVNGIRIGVARGVARALIGKVHDGISGETAAVAQAVKWAVQEGANVISMSLGADYARYVKLLMEVRHMELPQAMSIALEAYRENINLFSSLASFVQASSNGVILVAASGNSSDRPKYTVATTPPVANPSVISVGALQKTATGFDITRFSNTQVDIAAPGFNVRSANFKGGLSYLSGTSVAGPHVAGVAALWAQKQLDAQGYIDSAQLINDVKKSGNKNLISNTVTEDDVGTGMVQAPL